MTTYPYVCALCAADLAPGPVRLATDGSLLCDDLTGCRSRTDALRAGPARSEDVLRRLRAAGAAVDHFAADRDWHVREARDLGASWAQIGAALGVSRQAAQQRHGTAAAPAPRQQLVPVVDGQVRTVVLDGERVDVRWSAGDGAWLVLDDDGGYVSTEQVDGLDG